MEKLLQGNYVNGFLDGDVHYYYESGKKMIIERYKYNVRHGLWIYYKENGSLNKRRYFDRNTELKGKALEDKIAQLKAKGNG